MRKSKFTDSQILAMMKRMKELEDENRRLKKMYAEERLKAEIQGLYAEPRSGKMSEEN